MGLLITGKTYSVSVAYSGCVLLEKFDLERDMWIRSASIKQQTATGFQRPASLLTNMHPTDHGFKLAATTQS